MVGVFHTHVSEPCSEGLSWLRVLIATPSSGFRHPEQFCDIDPWVLEVLDCLCSRDEMHECICQRQSAVDIGLVKLVLGREGIGAEQMHSHVMGGDARYPSRRKYDCRLDLR